MRIAIVGGPGTGKTTLANEIGAADTRHTDDVIDLGWEGARDAVAGWLDDGADVVEGVQAARALRHWLRTHDEGAPVDRVIVLQQPFTEQTDGQRRMATGVMTVFDDIRQALVDRGVEIIDGVDGNVGAVHMSERMERRVPIAKVDNERRLVYGVVYEPGVADAHGDWASPATVESMAHGFMTNFGIRKGALGAEHKVDFGADSLAPVESYIAPTDFVLGGQTVRAGSWVLVGKVHDDGLWKAVRDGSFTGWSLEGLATRRPGAPQGTA